jgi:hypothetical protein
MSIYLLIFLPSSQYLTRFVRSNRIPLGGSTNKIGTSIPSNGKKDMEHLQLAIRKWTVFGLISPIKNHIIKS